MSRPGPGSTPGASPAATSGVSAPRPRRRVSFRLPAWALLLPLIALLCAMPLATAGGWLTWLAYGIPVLVLAGTLLTRTSADARHITVVGPWRRHTIPWAELDRLEFTGTRWAVAVTGSGKRVRLVMVRPRDLPALTAVAGGELVLAEDEQTAPDPTGSQDGNAGDMAAGAPGGIAGADTDEAAAGDGTGQRSGTTSGNEEAGESPGTRPLPVDPPGGPVHEVPSAAAAPDQEGEATTAGRR